MKTYVGYRRRMGLADWVDLGWSIEEATRLKAEAPHVQHVAVAVVSDEGVEPLKHYARHSPTGFEWGYFGSGPADLARCILIDHLGMSGEEAADPHHPFGVDYQAFKFDHVATLDRAGPWSITSEQIDAWIEGQR